MTELHAKNGDLDLEKQNLADELQQFQAELEKVRSHSSDSTAIQLPEPAALLNQLKGKLGKKSKATLQDVEAIIEALGM